MIALGSHNKTDNIDNDYTKVVIEEYHHNVQHRRVSIELLDLVDIKYEYRFAGDFYTHWEEKPSH
jgi:hypothetical protein